MNPNDPYLDDEIDLRELFNVLWEERILIIIITSIFAIGSIFYSLSLTNHYLSQSVLVANSGSDNAGVLSQYAGLASIAGVSLPGSKSSSVTEVMEMIKSREFVNHLLTFEDILPSIMAPKSYDINSKELYFDSKIYDSKIKTWTREPTKNKRSKPSYLEAHKEYLGSLLSISQDRETGFVSIKINHISPVFAKDFLALIINEANTLKREKDIETSTKALSYLNKELSETPFVEIKGSINQLIEVQLETKMMAKVNEEYSLVIIEPPFIPEEKAGPNRALICQLGTLLGGMLGMIIVLLRHYNVGQDSFRKKHLSD